MKNSKAMKQLGDSFKEKNKISRTIKIYKFAFENGDNDAKVLLKDYLHFFAEQKSGLNPYDDNRRSKNEAIIIFEVSPTKSSEFRALTKIGRRMLLLLDFLYSSSALYFSNLFHFSRKTFEFIHLL